MLFHWGPVTSLNYFFSWELLPMGSSYTWEYTESILKPAFLETIAFILLLSLFPHCWWVLPFHEHLFLSTFVFLNSFCELVRNKPRRAPFILFSSFVVSSTFKGVTLILLGSILSKCLHSLNMPLRQWPFFIWLVIIQIKPNHYHLLQAWLLITCLFHFPSLAFFFFLNFILKSETFNGLPHSALWTLEKLYIFVMLGNIFLLLSRKCDLFHVILIMQIITQLCFVN